MTWFNADVHITTTMPTDKQVDTVLDELTTYHVGALVNDPLSTTISLEASDRATAKNNAEKAVADAFRKAGLTATTSAVSVLTDDEFHRAEAH